MCIVHGSQMQTRLCELWRRKEVGTEWAAGSLACWRLFTATPALVGGRWIIFATRSPCVMQQSWEGWGSESISNYLFYAWTSHDKKGQTL